MKLKGLICALALTATLGACDLFTGPDRPTGSVSLSVMVPGTGAAASAARLFAAGELVFTDGAGNTLTISSAHLVLREIEFERVDPLAGCDAAEGEEEGSDDDACEKFETDPVLVTLPLDGTVDIQMTAEVPYGEYDEVEFEVHKVSGDDPADAAFLDANPGYDGVSVRVTGTWNTVPFEYTSDLNEDQEIRLPSPMVIDENSGPVNVTFSIDIETWVRDAATGALIDPNGEDNWKHNVKNSIEGFEDDDHDGVPHGDDADEGGAGA